MKVGEGEGLEVGVYLAAKGQTGYVPAGIEQTGHEKNRETNNL